MDERFTRLFSLPENLGLDGCPIVISAGVLLKDNVTRNILVQLKLRNLSPQEIKAVQVKINAYDITGAVLEGVNTFSYLDLSVPLDGDFGSQTPIWLPDATARSFTVDILSVTLADGTVYVPAEGQVYPDGCGGCAGKNNRTGRQKSSAGQMGAFEAGAAYPADSFGNFTLLRCSDFYHSIYDLCKPHDLEITLSLNFTEKKNRMPGNWHPVLFFAYGRHHRLPSFSGSER